MFKGSMDLGSIMKMAKQVQMEAKRLKEEVEKKEFTASAGGGAVEVVVKGTGEIIDVKISPELVSSGDAEMIGDLIVLASNQAIREAKKSLEDVMDGLTGNLGIDIGGLF